MIQADDIFKKIGFILNDLQDQQEYLAHHPEKVNAPELELFLANANFLADHVKVYARLKTAEVNAQDTTEAVKPVSAPIAAPPNEEVKEVIQEDLPTPVAVAAAAEENESRIDLQPAETIVSLSFEEEVFKPDASPAPFEFILDQSETTDQFDFETQSVEERFDRKLSDEEQEIVNSKQQVTEPKIEEEEDEIGPEPFLISVPQVEEIKTEIIPEVIQVAALPEQALEKPDPSAKKPTLNELLAQRSVGATPATPRKVVSDLKQAISLNDKLLFIKELFNGYNLAYAEAIDLINKMQDLDAADTFLKKNYAEKNGWNEKQATVDRFYEVLNQRFLG